MATEILTWVILGLIAGVIAKFLMGGGEASGWLLTIVLGIVGAIVGGWVSSALGIHTTGGLHLGNILISAAGAMLVLFLYRKFAR